MRLGEIRTKPSKGKVNNTGGELHDLLNKITTGEIDPDSIPDDHLHKELINHYRDYGLIPGHLPKKPPQTISSADHEKTAQALFGNVIVDKQKLASLLHSDIQLRWRLERLGVISYNRK